MSRMNKPTERMFVTVNYETGDKEYEVVTIFELNKQDYIVLMPIDQKKNPCPNEEVCFFRYFEQSDDDFSLDNIESDEEYDAVADYYDELLDDEEFDAMD